MTAFLNKKKEEKKKKKKKLKFQMVRVDTLVMNNAW